MVDTVSGDQYNDFCVTVGDKNNSWPGTIFGSMFRDCYRCEAKITNSTCTITVSNIFNNTASITTGDVPYVVFCYN